VLGYCPGCYQNVNAVDNVHLIRTYDDSTEQLETTAIHCLHCDDSLHLYWFTTAFASAMDTANIDIEDDEDDYQHPDAPSMMAARVERAARTYDFWSSMYLCCDKPFLECSCNNPISFETARSVAYDRFDSLSDMYEWTENLQMMLQGKDSCMNCVDYLNPSCVILRERLADMVKADLEFQMYEHIPITLCDAYEYDPLSSASLNIT
jgi:hypothetical protein